MPVDTICVLCEREMRVMAYDDTIPVCSKCSGAPRSLPPADTLSWEMEVVVLSLEVSDNRGLEADVEDVISIVLDDWTISLDEAVQWMSEAGLWDFLVVLPDLSAIAMSPLNILRHQLRLTMRAELLAKYLLAQHEESSVQVCPVCGAMCNEDVTIEDHSACYDCHKARLNGEIDDA